MTSSPQKLPFVPPTEGCEIERVHHVGPFVTRVELKLPDGQLWIWTSRNHRFAGTRVKETCRKMEVSEATVYNWKKKYGGMGVSEIRRLKQLEQENARLERLVADLSLDKEMLQEVIRKGCEACQKARDGRLDD